MLRPPRVSASLGLLLALTSATARADVPPPAGQTRVQYAVRVVGGGPGVALVAHPTYGPEGGSVALVSPEQELRFVQGYQPGIYSLPAEEAAALVGRSGEEVDRALAAKGRVCVQKVPRVFQVATETRITAMTDVFEIAATPTSCRATLARTIYGGADGQTGEGTVDAAGRRVPPAPFTDRDLPVVAALGFAPGPSTASAPARPPANPPASEGPPASEKAGCAIAATEGHERALLVLVFVAVVRRRRRR